jgi:hypothetical protein
MFVGRITAENEQTRKYGLERQCETRKHKQKEGKKQKQTWQHFRSIDNHQIALKLNSSMIDVTMTLIQSNAKSFSSLKAENKKKKTPPSFQTLAFQNRFGCLVALTKLL